MSASSSPQSRGGESPLGALPPKRRRLESGGCASTGALLPHPTAEQREIVELARCGDSFAVVANAGTGKTRTLLKAAAATQRRTLFLAYNRDIKEEVQRLVDAHGLAHVDVENFDSLLLNYYDRKAVSQDFQLCLHRVLDDGDGARPLKDMLWEAVFVDEAQDMDESYMRLLRKVLKDNLLPGAVQVVAVGDPKQNIFKYRGATAEYFLRHDLCATGAATPVLTLSTSFRFNADVCAFVDALCAPLHAASGGYLGHVSGLPHMPGGVEHWVLMGKAAAKPGALVARLQALRAELEAEAAAAGPEERLLAFLTGSQRESNDALWGFVEHLGCLEPAAAPYSLVVEDPAVVPSGGLPLAFVRNVHGCKGKTFAVAVLFVTTRRSWIKQGGCGVEKETLYVALTRARRLLVVERSDTLLFQEVCHAALGPDQPSLATWPHPRCATTGAFLPLPLERHVWDGGCSFAKPFLAERVTKMTVAAKRRLMELIDAPPLCDWAEGAEPEADAAASKDGLHALAAWLRLEHAHEQSKSNFNAFFTALRTQPIEAAYAQLWKARRRRPLAPRLHERLRALAARPIAAADYLEAARFHPAFQYGYLALAEADAADIDRVEALYRALEQELGRLRDPQRVFELRLDAPQPVVESGLYVTADDVVVLLKAETVEVEGLHDRLLAAYVSAKLRCASYEVRYVPLDRYRGIRVAAGRVAEELRQDYVGTLERAVAAA